MPNSDRFSITTVRKVYAPYAAERYALKDSQVDIGDIVYQADTDVFYFVVDTSNLDSDAGYAEATGGGGGGSNPTFSSITFPMFQAPDAKGVIRTYDGGFPDDVMVFGTNLSGTLYVPLDYNEPQLYMGLETHPIDPAWGNAHTSEIYWRYNPIGNDTFAGYLEMLFFNVNRNTNRILFGHMNADILALANTDDTLRFFSASDDGIAICGTPANGPLVEVPVAIGPFTTPDVSFGVNRDAPIISYTALVETNPVLVKYNNLGGTVVVGLNGSSATGIFSSGGTAYGFAINNTLTSPISFGHGSVQMTLLNSGNVGIGVTDPLAKLAVTGASSDGNAIFEITTGTGINEDNKMQFGVHDGDYTWIQSIAPGVAYHHLILQPQAGSVGIGTTAPGALLHLKAASSPSIRFEETGGTITYDIINDGLDLVFADITNGRAPITIKNSGAVEVFGVVRSGAGSTLTLATLDTNKDVLVVPHGTGGLQTTFANTKLRFHESSSLVYGYALPVGTSPTSSNYWFAHAGGELYFNADAALTNINLQTQHVTRLAVGSNGITTEAPAGHTASAWKLGNYDTGLTALVLSTTKAVWVDVGGSVVKLAIVE